MDEVFILNMNETLKGKGRNAGMGQELERVKVIGIAIRHGPLDVSEEERDPEVIKNANITPEGEEQIRTDTVPYLVKKVGEEPDRKVIFLVRANENRTRTLKTAQHIFRETRKALRAAGLSRQAKIFYRGHAEILDTTPPLAARVKRGDTKGGAAINWIMDNEETQAAKGIEPPGSVYERIKDKEGETYRATINKQIAVNQKKYPGRVRLKQGPRFSAPQLKNHNITVIHIGVGHENFHGTILKNVDSIKEALRVDFLEPLEMHATNRGQGVIYSAPKRGTAYPVARSLARNNVRKTTS